MSTKAPFIPYTGPQLSEEETLKNSQDHFDYMDRRRSIREIDASREVPQEVIENLIKIASSAPSGAHKQPWTFVAISNPELKAKIKEAAEEEERTFYGGRASEEWLKDLEPFGTDWHKDFITDSPWIIVVFRKIYNETPEGKTKNYYVQESVGIATGFLLQAIHQCGLVSLTHTPSPMDFLSEILERPKNEKPFLLIPVGYAKPGVEVPNIERKDLSEVSIFKV